MRRTNSKYVYVVVFDKVLISIVCCREIGYEFAAERERIDVDFEL